MSRDAVDLRVVAPSTATPGDDAFTVHVHADSAGDVQLALKDSRSRKVAEQNGSLAELKDGQETGTFVRGVWTRLSSTVVLYLEFHGQFTLSVRCFAC